MAPFFVVLLVLLLIAWTGLLFGGYFLARPVPMYERRMPRWTRLASSFVLVLASWLFVIVTRATVLAPYSPFIATGMTLGFVGDLFMAQAIPVKHHTLAGMGAFALGHVAYIVAGLRLASILGLTASAPRMVAWLCWLVIGAGGWYFVIFRGQQLSALHTAALPYALLLASTTGIATGLAVQDTALITLALGAALFLFSDLMIAAKLFAGKSLRWIPMDDLIWLTYGPGQCLIVYTCALLLRRL